MNREGIIAGAISELESAGYSVETFLGSNNCFDIIARNGKKALIIKAYENIDSIRKEQGAELRKLASVLGAGCIIIGDRTKVFSLEDGTVYFRYDLPSVTLPTFVKILGGECPHAMYFKGKRTVEIDPAALGNGREFAGISVEELARKVGVAPETIYRFEKGAATSPETCRKLEKELHGAVKMQVSIFGESRKSFEDEQPDEELLGKVHDIGMRLSLFWHSPFRAYGEPEKGIFIGTGKGKADIPKKAFELRKTSAAIGKDSVIITKEYNHASIEGIPVIKEEELETMSKPGDLRELISEKKKQKK
ncbi:Helix-turn-helix [uncultured archaeon]|nr:Helix-turn-helix [uncultured archaeon]